MKRLPMKRNIAILIILISAMSAFCYAEDFIYSDNDRRDPFVPLLTKDGKLNIGYGGVTSIDEVILEGILYDPKGGSIAIMNDRMLREHDRIGKIEVRKIEKNRVILWFNDKEYTFKPKE